MNVCVGFQVECYDAQDGSDAYVYDFKTNADYPYSQTPWDAEGVSQGLTASKKETIAMPTSTTTQAISAVAGGMAAMVIAVLAVSLRYVSVEISLYCGKCGGTAGTCYSAREPNLFSSIALCITCIAPLPSARFE